MFSSHARSLLLWRFHLRRLRFINTQNVTVGTRGWLHKNLWKSINHSSVTYYKNIRCLMLKAKIWMIKKFWHLHIYIGLVLKGKKKKNDRSTRFMMIPSCCFNLTSDVHVSYSWREEIPRKDSTLPAEVALVCSKTSILSWQFSRLPFWRLLLPWLAPV